MRAEPCGGHPVALPVPLQKQDPDGFVREHCLWGPDGSGKESQVHLVHSPWAVPAERVDEFPL